MAKLTKNQIRHTADLAKIRLSEEEVSKFYSQIEGFLKYAEKMNEVDTSSVEETSQVTGIQNSFRDDIVEPSLSQKDVLSNAPESDKGYFKVRKYHDNQ